MRALALLLPLTTLLACAEAEKEETDGGADGSADGADGSADGADGSADGADGSADGADGTDGTDGTGEALYGPPNAWYHTPASEVPEGLTGTGTRVGDTLANFTVTDQNGDEVELYQFYGQVVQLVLFAEWCGPCNAEAPAIEAASRDLADDGVIILDVMMEQSDGSTPDLDALGRWVAAYSVTHPMVIGGSSFNPLIQGGYPTLPVLNRDMTIATADNFPFNEGYLEDLASR